MILRRLVSFSAVLAVLPVAVSLLGCNSLKQLTISPGAGVSVIPVGQTVQFTAVGVSQMGSGTSTTSNQTNSVTWSVSNAAIASISASGLATALAPGYTQVSAEANGIIATSDLTVSASSSSGSGSGTPFLSVVPNSATDTFVGETTQFLASGSLTGGAAQNLTTQVQWISSNTQVATVNASGLATAVGAGTTTITAYSGGLTASTTLTVVVSTSASSATLAIIPTSANATFAGETTQFIAIGNLTGGTATVNLTNNVSWSSSDVSVETIDQSGLATAQAINQSTNSTTITAIGTTNTGSLITATATLTSVPTTNTVVLPTLAVYMTGLGTGTVTSSPGTLACGSSAAGASCTNSYSLGATVTLTATPASGSTFAGWSSNCAVTGNPLQCSIVVSNNETVGAIFNH